MKVILWGTLACCVVIPAVADESAGEDFNKMGRLGYALWECAAYGSLASVENPVPIQFFEAGHETLSTFVAAWKEGKLTKENTNKVPIGLSWWLTSGPSVEFSMGYMWAQFVDHAHSETWPEVQGTSFTHEDLTEIQTLRATTAFQNKNCTLLMEKQ